MKTISQSFVRLNLLQTTFPSVLYSQRQAAKQLHTHLITYVCSAWLNQAGFKSCFNSNSVILALSFPTRHLTVTSSVLNLREKEIACSNCNALPGHTMLGVQFVWGSSERRCFHTHGLVKTGSVLKLLVSSPLVHSPSLNLYPAVQ